MAEINPPFVLWKHLNKLRWLVLISVLMVLIALPFISLYQNFVAAHAYDLLAPSEQKIYDVVEWFTDPFVSDPANDLDAIKGTTWSANFWEYKISDPLAVVGQVSAGLTLYSPFLITALIPVLLTLFFGRFFCGWICPATLLYELNTNFAGWLSKHDIKFTSKHLNPRLKYAILLFGILFAMVTGSVIFAPFYPPAIIGREIYFSIALGGFGVGIVFFALTLFFDLMVGKRGFCRYLCPGGALYSLLGRFRVLRIQRIVEKCNDCAMCNAVCEFSLDPLNDDFGQECNNCTACIAVCPTDAMTFTINIQDLPYQGAGHLGRAYQRQQDSENQP